MINNYANISQHQEKNFLSIEKKMTHNVDGILSQRTSLQSMVQPIGFLIKNEVCKCMNVQHSMKISVNMVVDDFQHSKLILHHLFVCLHFSIQMENVIKK